jgi:hypothetical protein
MTKKTKVFVYLFTCLFVYLFISAPVSAITLITDLHIDTPTLAKGYTVQSNDQNFNLGIRPEVLAVETRVVIKQFDKAEFEFPEGWRPLTNVYEFDIFNKAAFQDEKPLIIQLLAEQPTRHLKRIYFWNGVISKWVELPSWTHDEEKIRSIIHLPYAKMVVLEHEEVLEIGHASWYAYKDCDCAASPDYPKGTLLKVKNMENDKEVIVKVNDYGPDRSIFPLRVIDLDKVAFKKLGSLGAGVLKKIVVSLEK